MIKLKEEWKQLSGKYKCPFCSKEFSKNGICSHIWRTHDNGKDFKPSLGKSGWNKGLTKDTDIRVANNGKSISKSMIGVKQSPLSEEHKNSISESMKKAHAEGRAWNIGMSRWNNEPSYPEKFFMKVIENEFDDKDYEREVPFHRFSLDFVWKHKKKVIEIDGSQHERFEDQIKRDKEKDRLLLEEDWQVLRIKWKDFYHDTKKWIKISKEFLDS